MDNPYSVDLLAGGPGAPPQPWVVQGATIRYDGCVMVPSNVAGGDTGPGSINANALYIKGIQFVNPVGSYLPLTGGTLTGPLAIFSPSALNIGGGQLGQALVTNGAGVLSWSSNPPGGPYLSLAGGTLSGPLTIPAPSGLVLGGGQPGNVLSTNGLGTLAWVTPSGGGGGGASITISDTAPLSPAIGSLWWDSVGGQLYLWYSDVNSSQWTPTTNQFGGGYLALTGGTLSGALTLATDPVAPLQPVTQQYFNKYPMIGDNRIINGDMRIDQRWNGAAQTAVFSYTVDRWEVRSSQAGKGSWGRALNSGAGFLAGFPYALGFTSSTAYTLVGNDYFLFDQLIEADMISDFAFGTASAQPITLSFWAWSSLTGTFAGTIQNFAQDRSYVFSYSIPVANTWTKIIITTPGDTAGTWVLNGNAGALRVVFSIATGSGYAIAPNIWQSGAWFTVAGAVSIFGTNGANFYVTGVKLEIGSVATPFNRYSLAKSLADCQRYYQSISTPIAEGYNAAGGSWYNTFGFMTAMRAVPTVTFSGITYSNASGLVLNAGYVSSIMTRINVTAAGAGYATFAFTASAEL